MRITKLVERLIITTKSIIIFAKIKIKYRRAVNLHLINSIRGKLKIDLYPKALLTIGDFLMTAGPLYIKCGNKASLSIGTDVSLTIIAQ